ncbi:sensor histidine kinase [Portibacter marinus]|uniref:sensor histidine kinase n=1 Tax=Portibacter marinus TaxID=2898660 RepID=UPI001F3178B8|nr:histidine kinase dimerization/phosphoacceptor domain -containing protein [Portibacter marinus]
MIITISRIATSCCFYLLVIAHLTSQSFSISDVQTLPIDSTLSWMQKNYTKDSIDFHDISLSALDKAYELGEHELMGDVHTSLSNWHGYHYKFGSDSIIYHGEKALYHFERAGNRKKIADTYKNLSIDYMNNNSYDNAEEILFEAIKIYEELEDEQGLAGCYKNLSSMFRVLEEPEQSIKYANSAIPIFEKELDYYNHSITLFNLIISHRLLKNYEEAYQAANTCIAMVDEHIPSEVFIKSRAYSYRSDISKETGDFDEMLKDATQAWKIVENKIGVEGAAQYRVEVGDAYRLKGDYESALDHMLVGVKSLENRGIEQIWDPYFNLADTYMNLNDYEKAYEYQRKGLAAKTKMIDDKISNLESEAVIKYETGKKDQALLLQERQLKQKTRIQWLTIGIAIILATLLFVVFYFYRKNRKITEELSLKNQENELLLKEIHHRVKNNLQTISSLLNIQSKSIENSAAYDVIIESKNRVASMALIHQKLYQGENLASIEMSNYFKTMGEAIRDGFGEIAENVLIKVEMNEIEMDIDSAVPIGLIANELITNAIKYAFPRKQQGVISISLETLPTNNYRLIIADNGIPDAKSSEEKGTGFGSILINLLTMQLGGVLNIVKENGTAAILNFPPQIKSAV